MTKKFYTYILTDPMDNIVRYVGATLNPKTRLSTHMCDKISNKEKYKWMLKLKLHGLRPVLTVMGEFDNYQSAAIDEVNLYNKFNNGQLLCKNPAKHSYKPTGFHMDGLTRFFLTERDFSKLKRICAERAITVEQQIEEWIREESKRLGVEIKPVLNNS